MVRLRRKSQKHLALFSFYHVDIHYNLIVKLLSDRFGIQVRGGCVCAGTYGHFLLEVSYNKSKKITDKIASGDLSGKPGWIRWSLHPTTRDDEIFYFANALKSIVDNIKDWKEDYFYNSKTNEFILKDDKGERQKEVQSGFTLE